MSPDVIRVSTADCLSEQFDEREEGPWFGNPGLGATGAGDPQRQLKAALTRRAMREVLSR
jgi:hypothetical protein